MADIGSDEGMGGRAGDVIGDTVGTAVGDSDVYKITRETSECMMRILSVFIMCTRGGDSLSLDKQLEYKEGHRMSCLLPQLVHSAGGRL